MGGPLSFLLQKHFSILVLKYIKRQRGGGMNDFPQKQFSHHTVTHFNTDTPPCLNCPHTPLNPLFQCLIEYILKYGHF